MRFLGEEDSIVTTSIYPNFELAEFLADRSLEYRINDSGDHKELSTNCPKCVYRGEPTPDTNKKLWINSEKGTFHCYRCKWSGSLVRLVQGLAQCSLEQAIRILKGKLLDPLDYMDLKLHIEKIEPDEAESDPLRDVELPYGYVPLEGEHPYLTKRKLPWQYAVKHDWGIAEAGYCKDRIIIPFFMNGRLVFWQARATWEEPENRDFKKVLNPKGVSARAILYNFDVAREYETVIITEGFMDAAKVGSNAMATNGKMFHVEQCEFLKETNCKEVILAWDADAWTDERRKKDGTLIKPCSMARATDLLRGYGFKVRCARLPHKRDPGSYPYKSKELLDIIHSAKEPDFSKTST